MLLKLEKTGLSEDFLSKMQASKPLALEKFQSLVDKTCTGSENIAWWNWPEHSGFETLKQIREEILQIRVTFDLIVVVGIGGSFAGTRAVAEALRHQFADQIFKESQRYIPIVYAGNNLSERSMLELLDLMEEHEPLINVISKSGSTIEPNVAFRILEEGLTKRFGKEASQRILVTTQNNKNVLHELAEKKHYTLFPVPSDVGGRYSVLTSAGLLPLSLAGYDTEQLLAGADRLFEELKGEASSEHPVFDYASFRKTAWDEGKTLDILAFREPKLSALMEWWKQLFAESEGKEGKGMMPIGMSYSTDLHSIGQYLQEGPANMIESFLNFGATKSFIEKRVKIPVDEQGHSKVARLLFNRYIDEVDQAAWEASQKAHSQRGVPCIELNLAQLDEYHLGYLFAFFQVACAIGGLLLGVNPFNQPGVEVYKHEMHTLLAK